MRRYESYKDSGVEWLGEVPSHWELKRLKQLFVEKKHRQNLSLNCGAISFGKVIEKADDKVTEATKRSYQEVLKGEFLINPLNLNYDLISLRIALSEIDVVVSAGYIVLKEKQIINKKYFSYLLHRYDVAYMKLLGSGVRQTINYGHISDSILVIPPLSEQQKIAQFLDDKTAKIDQAVDWAEKQIALLKEHKQILIQNAVTRGLNPDVPLKDSGVKWIGRVPEHWNVKKLKNIAVIFNGATPSSNNQDYWDGNWDGNIVWITPKDINNIKFITSSERKITQKGYENCGSSLVSPGTIVITTRAPIGKVAITDVELCTNQGCKSLVLNEKINNIFLYYYLTVSTEYLNSLGSGTTFMELSGTALGIIKVPFPTIQEQQQIADYLDTQTAKIDQAIALKTAHIEKLKEYRNVLINDVVTGKVQV